MAVTLKGPTVKSAPLDVARIRKDFPILAQTVRGKPLVYLDNAATSQKPRQVIDAMSQVFEEHNANIHRGVYEFSERTTALFEEARAKVARFINAPSEREIIFVRNATEALNLVAYAWGRDNIKRGDRIVTTVLEHHSDFVPWQQLATEVGAEIAVVDIDDDGRLRRDQLSSELRKGAKLLVITHTSNGLGTVNPVKEIAAEARATGATVLVDVAQAVPHTPVDVQDLGADFVAFSGHKMLAPPGSGALWGRAEILEKMRPFLYGGDMIAEAVGLGAAVDYLEAAGLDAIEAHEHELAAYALGRLADVPGIVVYGPSADRRAGVVSFNLEGIHPHDVAQILDRQGVAIRAGHHCCQPLMHKLGVAATNRASFYLYTVREEIDQLVEGLHNVRKVFA